MILARRRETYQWPEIDQQSVVDFAIEIGALAALALVLALAIHFLRASAGRQP